MSEVCDACQKKYEAIYWVPNEVWEDIKPKQSGYGGLLCVECAHKRALDKGYTLRFSASYNWWGEIHDT